MIQVTGVFTDPLGNPLAEVAIRLTSVESAFSPKGAYVVKTTSITGAYSFSLYEGVFLIELKQADEYTQGVLVKITPEMSGVYTLALLLENYLYTPITEAEVPV